MKQKQMAGCRRSAALLLIILLSLSGCGAGDAGQEAPSAKRPLRIVCTIFPEYDWTREILGSLAEDAELTLLMKNGSDMHSYQPSFQDLVKIAEADLFLYVGGESDFWVEDVLENGKNPDRKVLNLLEVLEDSVKEEERVEGMRAERGHEHGAQEAHCAVEEAEYDEHVWLSLRNAQEACSAIEKAVCELDPGGAEEYQRNASDYREALEALDLAYGETVEQAKTRTLLFGDRFPFRYLTEDYGLAYYAAFPGCSAETEAGFDTITFLAEKAEELGLPAILTVDGSDQKIARTIAGNTRGRGQQVLVLDSMQSVTEEDIEKGESYLSIMEANLAVLGEALAMEGR